MSRAACGAFLLLLLLLHLLMLVLTVSSVPPVPPNQRPLRLSGTLPENSPAGTLVSGVLLADCPGTNIPSNLSGHYASHFRLVRLGGLDRGHLGLVSSKVLDREFIAMYRLTVQLPRRCRTRTAALQVEVTDRNDNAPRIIGGNRTVEVDETTPLGTVLARFQARDADAERNGRVTFYASPECALLQVEPRGGQVRLRRPLLDVQSLSLRIQATDGGDEPLLSEPVFLHVRVRRTQRGDRRPRSLSAAERSFSVAVPEGLRVGELLFTVPDRSFQRRRFQLLLGDEREPPVRIEPDSGRLFLARSLQEPAEVLVKILDLEGAGWYLCRLTLAPPPQPHLHWVMSPSPYLAAVDPDAPPASLVYQLVAQQVDGSQGETSYFLVEGGEGCFEVDRRSGQIRTTGRPLTPSREYVLQVQAVAGDGGKSVPASVAVLAGERPPQFIGAPYRLDVPENKAVGQTVAVVQALSFQQRALSYLLQLNPGNLFSIHQQSGALSLTSPVDFEAGTNLHSLQVRASEADSGLSSVAELVVHITDENDCTPEFLHAIYSRDGVPESTPVGTSLLQVSARDCDSGSNSRLSYWVEGGDFEVTAGGVVRPIRQLDYERPSHQYQFVVLAVDSGQPARTGTASVRVRITNCNDEAPIFSQSIYRTFLSEDAGPDTLVAIVLANDPDGDAVSYAITGGNEDSNFLLDKEKGIITLRRSPPPSLRGPQYVLNITATDDNASGGPYPLSSAAQVVVGINDINNNKPLFHQCENYSRTAVVLENQPAGTFVLQVQAQDADTGVNGEVKYGIMQRDGVSPGFHIDPDSGVITTATAFDRERQRQFTLSVTATDQADQPLVGICSLTVQVADQNDNKPRFENSRYQYFLREDTPVGTSFLRAAAHDDDHGSNAAITYSLSNQTPAYLHINPSTGWVFVNQPISQTSRIVQQIVATDGGQRSSSVELSVTITNLHNQPPQWEEPEYWVTVPENAVRDAKILTIKATSALGDPRVTYTLEEGQVAETNMPVRFYLKPNRAEGSASLLVAENLDFEATPSFTLRVRVQNVAAVPLASFTTVHVNVTDVNDNVPFFLSSTYEAAIPEGTQVGTAVVQVSAVDLDSGQHGRVRYSILRDQSGDWRFFTIDPSSGAVVTRATLDREQKATYLIEVQSQDGTESARQGQQGQPNTDTAYVRIFVTDVNDNAPSFPQLLYQVSAEEGQEVGVVLVTVTANDEDEGANAKLRYQITAGNAMGHFGVEPEVGAIFVARPLDYETEQRYELRLVASDGKWENQTLVVVQVVNHNDEVPVFSQTEYRATVSEELAQPVLILEVSARDPDKEADQKALRYSLHGQGAGGEFTIEERTGRIFAQQRLDREERSAWRFLVLATDEEGAGLTGFADVLLEVQDINDNVPFFPCPALEVDGCFVGKVAENSPAATSVMEMRAVDLDDPNQDQNAMLTYSIIKNVRNYINLDLFSINASTGTIYTVLGSLDRETEWRYLVVVEARDGGGLAGTGTATILVSDVNDHPPIFTQKLYTTQVTEDLEVNSEVLVVSATDGDEGENAVVTFSIVGGDEDRKFWVETDKVNRRGVIKLQKKVDFEKPQERSFNLTLKAEDADFFSLAQCLVQVEDSNDHAPVFLPQFYESSAMSEDVPVGTIVAQVTASDPDSGRNGRFSYSISKESDPHGQFLVDQSGWVVVSAPLDREKVWQHRIMVLATDGGHPTLTGTAVVVVTVLDVNDNGPEFEVPYRPIVWENTPAPQAVQINRTSFLLHAMDRDTSANGAPYSIHLLPLTSDATSFNLTDFRNGSAAITALRTFDREHQKEYRLPILMTDSGSPPMSATSTLTVIIGDQNDHPHSPGHAHFIVYSHQGFLPTTVLGRVQSPDLDDWGQKIYSFQGTPPRLFSLNRTSGLLSVREGAPVGSYRLQVLVSEPVWPDVTCTAQVDILELQPEALQSSASLRLSNLTVEQFFANRGSQLSPFNRLTAVLAEVLEEPTECVHIFSVGRVTRLGVESVDVWVAADGCRREKLLGYVEVNRAKLESVVGVSISQVGVDDCPHTDCSGLEGCSTQVSFGHSPLALGTGNTSLVSLAASTATQCGCSGRQRLHLPCSAHLTNPCLNGGTCLDGPLGYRCHCPLLLDGPECQQTRRSFGGRGYAWFPPLRPCFHSHLSLEFLADSPDGLLLYNGPLGLGQSHEPEDFLALELRGGALVLSVNHGSGTLTLQLEAAPVITDRRWHRLDITSDGKTVQLVLDRCEGVEPAGGAIPEGEEPGCRATGETPGQQRYLDVFQPLQLGGVKGGALQRHHQGYSGCIRNLQLDTQVYDLASPGESVDSTAGCRQTDGVCVTAGSPSCGAQASCIASWGSFICECQPGYTGPKCDNVVPEFSLDPGSLLRFQLQGGLSSSRHTSVQLLVRTRTASGTLLALGSRRAGHYLVLELSEGRLTVRADLGDGAHRLQLPGHRLDLGQWVQVGLHRYGNLFVLHLEQGGGDREVQARLGRKTQLLLDPDGVTVGGGLEWDQYQEQDLDEDWEKEQDKNQDLNQNPKQGHDQDQDFQGCLRDVRVNGQPLPLDGRSLERVLVLERRGVTAGCGSEACRAQPCQSPLRCVDLWRKHQCRCPSGQLTLPDEDSSSSASSTAPRCVPSPCSATSCRNGGVCQPLSADSFRCRCADGFRGRRCELGQVKGQRLAALSPSSILAISMCLLVFFAVLVAVTVWNQTGSRNQFRTRRVHQQLPAEQQSWEDVRENILNYDEEGGGEQDQDGYDITELQRPLCSSWSRSSSCTTAPLIKSSPGSQEGEGEVGEALPCGATPYLGVTHLHHHRRRCTAPPQQQRHPVDLRNYVCGMVWDADHDGGATPPDSYHVWCVEGAGSPAGSLSSLGEEGQEEEREGPDRGVVYDRLSQWGPKFQTLSLLYQQGPVQPAEGDADTSDATRGRHC